MATGPLFAAITAMGRPEYELLLQAGLSLAGLSNVACGDRRGVEWIVVSDGLQYPPRPATAPRELTRAKAGTQPNPLALIRDVAHQAGVPVTVLTNPGPPGPGPARNAGLDRVAAPWIITLDSDDTILPQGMCALLQAIETTPEAAWAAGRCPHTDKEGRRIWDGPTDHFTPGPIEPHSFWKAKLQLGGLPFLCTATLASTAAIRSVGGWP
ncbi:glycosyltransferase, partial [Streptomyces sp. NPDC001193]